MEIEFFVKPGTDQEWHQRWMDDFMAWFTDLGVRPDRLRLRPHSDEELSHYSKATSDIEYSFAWGWGELMGIANRTDFDLKAHSQHSGVRLDYFDDETNEHIVPYVVEPALGVDRALLVFLFDAYDEETVEGDTRVVLHLHPAIAPVKVAVLPLSRNERLVPKAREVYDMVRKSFVSQYDDAQSIGRRYRRQDEIGTPLAVTVDFKTIEEEQRRHHPRPGHHAADPRSHPGAPGHADGPLGWVGGRRCLLPAFTSQIHGCILPIDDMLRCHRRQFLRCNRLMGDWFVLVVDGMQSAWQLSHIDITCRMP